jgi:ribosomal protein L29
LEQQLQALKTELQQLRVLQVSYRVCYTAVV